MSRYDECEQANRLADAIAERDAALARAEKAETRLEANHCFVMEPDGTMRRVPCEVGSIPDGISCRDETIRQLDASRDRLRARNRALEEGLGLAKFALQAWGRQSSDYMQEKHGLADDLAAIDALLTPAQEDKP